MDHHLMQTLTGSWSYDDVWGFSDVQRADAAAARPPRRRRRPTFTIRRRAHLRPAAGAA
jgi:hypothetical protein